MMDFDWDKVMEEDRELTVEPYDEVKSYDGVLRSGGLEKCIGIGAYDSQDEAAYMTHIPGYKDDQELADMLNSFTFKIREDCEDFSAVEFYLCGATVETAPFIDDAPGLGELKTISDVGGQRLIAETFLQSRTDNLTIDWGAEDGYISELIVDHSSPDIFSYNRQVNPHNEKYI